MDEQQHGRAVASWLGEGFISLEAELRDEPTWHFVFGRNDPQGKLVALYHDPRPTARVFSMSFADGVWTMSREDPDMHQRWQSVVTPDRITGHWDASDDGGQTWRTDFDLVWERIAGR
jgi:hypothetical protein